MFRSYFEDVKPGFKRQLHDSPWCTAWPAGTYQKCDNNDIIPQATMGVGWKNVGAKGCPGGEKAICGKDFNETTQKHSCCLQVNGDMLNNCHPDWRSPSTPDCAQFIYSEMRDTLAKGKSLNDTYRGLGIWVAENPGKFEELKAKECPAIGGSSPAGSICDIWCNTHPRECHQSRMNFCAQGDNVSDPKCQNWKDVATRGGFDVSTFYNAEQSWCERGGEGRMRSQQCINWSMNPKMVTDSRTTKERYDGWFNSFCDQVHLFNDKKPSTWKPQDQKDLDLATLQCSCTLKPGIKPDDRTTLDSNPYCFNGNCIARSEAYKTLRGFDDKRTCPNICSSIIQNNAGGTGIIRNVTVIQNCFNAAGQSDVKNVIRAAIEKELSKNVLTLIRLYTITDQPLTIFKEFMEKEKPDLTAYKKAHDDLKFIDHAAKTDYDDFNQNVTYQAHQHVMQTLRLELLPEARQGYDKLMTMEWPRTEDPKKLEEKYSALSEGFAKILQGVQVSLDECLTNTTKLITLHGELVNERKRIIREVFIKKEGLGKDLTVLVAKINKIEKEEEKKNLLLKAEDLKDTITKLDTSFTENVKSNKILIDREKQYLVQVSTIMMSIVGLDKETEAVIGGTLKEKAQRNKLSADKALNEFIVKYTRVSELAKNGKLSKRDADLFVEYSEKKEKVIELHKQCLDIHNKPDLTEQLINELVVTREKLEATAHSLGTSLDAIEEYKEPTRDPPPGKEPGKEPRKDPEAKDNTFWYILISFIAVAFIGILWFIKRK